MAELAGIFTALGCREVRTYIQSGNVAFQAPAALARRLPGAVGEAIASRFGFKVPVVLRTAAELSEIVRGNPFLLAGAPPETLHVAFLAEAPSSARVAALDPARSPTDSFTVRGREIFLACPGGLGRTKLTNAYFDSKLGTVCTVRNWSTVRRLRDLVGG
jgi:uncharacterized protein (DUF1697 family)